MFKPARLALAIASMLALSTTAHAGLSTSVTAASDYLFDGVSQTDGHPALQASLDYAHDSGFYVGTWVSNVDFWPGTGDANVEQDYYAGYSFTATEGFDVDAGALYYTYYGVSDDVDYYEVFVGATFNGNTKLKYFYSNDDFVWSGKAFRLKANHSFELAENWALNLEATYTGFRDLAEANGFSDDHQLHGKIGVSTEIAGFTTELSFQATSKSDVYVAFYGEENVDDTILLTVSRSFDLM